MIVTPKRLVAHLEAWGVPFHLEPGYTDPKIDPYHGHNDMVGVVLHHTAGRDSLAFCMRGTFPPVRNCHFLVGRDGTVHVLSATGAYHAGLGGPWRITRFLTVPKDAGNSRLYGIEIESLGLSPRIDGSPQGMTREQVQSTAALCCALLDVMRPGPLAFNVGRVIRHKDWAPTRKIDTRQDLDWWRAVIRVAKSGREAKDRAASKAAVEAFITAHPNGSL